MLFVNIIKKIKTNEIVKLVILSIKEQPYILVLVFLGSLMSPRPNNSWIVSWGSKKQP